MREAIRPSGIRVRYNEDAFMLAELVPPAKGPRRGRPGRPTGPIPMPAKPTEDSEEIRNIMEALAGSELNLVESVELQPNIEATPPSGIRRPRAPSVSSQNISVDIETDENEQSVMLLEQDGFYSWVLPSDVHPTPSQKGTRGTRGASRKSVTFSIEVRPEKSDGAKARRGFIKDFVYGKIKAWIFRYAAKAGVQLGMKLLERNVKQGPVIINSATDPTAWKRPSNLSRIKLPKHRVPRILLMVHGTFSSTAGGFGALCAAHWGQEFLKAAFDYYDLVLGYDHRTLSENPYSNAVDIFECLTTLKTKHPAYIDAVCHSRGGLVLRSLVETILPATGTWHADMGKCVFVAATNGGTLLAEPDNWQTLIDLYTNLAAATSRALSLFPTTAVAGIVLKETVNTISSLVKALAAGALGTDAVPGIGAMEPDGRFVSEINKTQPGQKGPTESLYYVVQSNFEAKLLSGDEHEPKEFPKRLIFMLADKLIDQLMKEPNDLVVNTRSMAAIDVAAGNFVKDTLDFGKNAAVYHTNYFIRPELVQALIRWLDIPAPGGSRFSAPGTSTTMPLPAAADSNISVIESSATAEEARELIKDKSPAYLIVRRPYENNTLHYAFSPDEILEAAAERLTEEPLMNVLDLHETDASPEIRGTAPPEPARSGLRAPAQRGVLMEEDGPAGVIPEPEEVLPAEKLAQAATEQEDLGPPEKPRYASRASMTFRGRGPMPMTPPLSEPKSVESGKQPPEDISCNFQAAMDQQVKINQTAAIDITISREMIAAVKGRATATTKGKVKTDQKLIIHVAPKVNFNNVGESRVEVLPPGAKEPVMLSFDVCATDIGPGEVWVVFRQGVMPIAVLKLYPEVVEQLPDVVKRQNANQPTALISVPANPPHSLLIMERRNGNELRFSYELRSQVLDVLDMYESSAIKGDRMTYVQNLYAEIENRWISSGKDVTAFQEELRAYGGQLFDDLFPLPLQQILWDNRGRIQSILAMSEEPFIPWELVHLKKPGSSLGEETCFLGQLGLIRWLHGCGFPPNDLDIRKGERVRYVIPQYPHPKYKLAAVEEERQYLENKFGAQPITPQPNEVREALKGPAAFDLFHFAGHGMAENNNIAHAQLMLQGRVENDNYIPVYLSATTVEAFANLRGGELLIAKFNGTKFSD